MRNLLWVVGALLVLAITGRADTAPDYYPALKGTILMDLSRRGEFVFTGGAPTDCERKESKDLLFYYCDVKGTSITTKIGDKSETYNLERLSARFVTLKEGTEIIYVFRGTWVDKMDPNVKSRVGLYLFHMKSSPKEIRGKLSLEDYGINAAVQVSPSDLD